MHDELFGVFGGRDTFDRLRSPELFDEIVSGDSVTVGVRSKELGRPNRTSVYEGDDGHCVVWGELYPPEWAGSDPAEWLYRHFESTGDGALDDLNGSYLAVLEYGGRSLVATDQLRSRECFYTVDDPRVFGTDAVSVARSVRDRSIDYESLLEYLYLSVVLGTDTLYEEVKRVPFDGLLAPDGARSLDRFVYSEKSFDYAGQLADRLEAAIRRRTQMPRPLGLLLSAGYDSRALLATGEIDICYTVGEPDSQEVRSAERLANQYGADHEALPPDDRYLNTNPEMCRYTHGIKESLHIHHAGYESEMDVRSILHGWAFDSLLREHFVPQRTVNVMGRPLPVERIAPDPDPVEFLTRKLGYLPEASTVHDRFRALGLVDSNPGSFVDATIQQEFEACDDDDRIHNSLNRFGVSNLPSSPFRQHLSGVFQESFVAADANLLEWHLQTPPEHRNTRTYLDAIQRMDSQILRHRPPDRPHDSVVLNQAQKFLRRKLPFLEAFGTPWPNRRDIYERNRLDEILFAEQPWLHDNSPRFKLRLHDALCWLDAVESDTKVTPDSLFGEQTFSLVD